MPEPKPGSVIDSGFSISSRSVSDRLVLSLATSLIVLPVSFASFAIAAVVAESRPPESRAMVVFCGITKLFFV